MKKIFSIIILGWLLSGQAYADPKNPTDEWLKDKTVNDLTQKYGYKLSSANYGVGGPKNNISIYTLTSGKIVITCLVQKEYYQEPEILCFLP